MSKFAHLKFLALAAAFLGATIEGEDSTTVSNSQSPLTPTSTAPPSVTTSFTTGSSNATSLTPTSTLPTAVTPGLNHSSHTPTSTAPSVPTTLTAGNATSLTPTSTLPTAVTPGLSHSSHTPTSTAPSVPTTLTAGNATSLTPTSTLPTAVTPGLSHSSHTPTSTAPSVPTTLTADHSSSLTPTSTASPSVTTSLVTDSSISLNASNIAGHSSHTPSSRASSVTTTSDDISFTNSDTNSSTVTSQFTENATGKIYSTTPAEFTPTTIVQTSTSSCGSTYISCTANATDGNIILKISYNINDNASVEILNKLVKLQADKNMKIITLSDECNNYILLNKTNGICNKSCDLTNVEINPKSDLKFNIKLKENSVLFVEQSPEIRKCNFKYSWICNHTTENKTLINETNVTRENCGDYNCSVKIKNSKDGNTVVTKELKIEVEKPDNLSFNITELKNTSFKIQWNLKQSGLKPLENITIYYKLKETTKDCCTCKSASGSCICDDLKPFNKYDVYLRAFNKDCNGHSQSSQVSQRVKTEEGCPDKPKNNKYFYLSNNKIKVTCDELSTEAMKGENVSYGASIKNGTGKHMKTCQFIFEDLSYLTDYTIQLYVANNACTTSFGPLKITTLYNDKALIGSLAFLIIVTSIALVIVLYKIYILQRMSSRHPEESVELIGHDDEKQLLNVEPILFEQLIDTCKRKQADESRFFFAEFQSIPRVFTKFPVKEARKNCNSSKNRYVDILPYDYNRVQLTPVSGEQGSDYINASFIDGFNEPRKYIAAQGPKEETSNDFWKMVWEQKVTIIVMVTRCEEGKRPKCVQYWPTMDMNSMYFGDFSVRISEEKWCPDYVIRKLFISQKEKSPEREVTHIQFISWPDHGVPEDPHLLLKLRQRVNAFRNLFSGPIVVHCSAGVGRTGSYIGIDAMLQALEAEGRVDVYGYIVQLRRQRCLMVQVEAQYILIHQALMEYCLHGETEVSLSELPKHLNNFKKRDPPTEPSLLEVEFQRISLHTESRYQITGRREENQGKNKSPSMIAYDYNRVHLKVDNDNSKDSENQSDCESSSDDSEDEDSTKYINASYIEGYWHSESLIATQTPLPETIADFWMMVYQKKVKIIVFLGKLKDNKDSTKYWENGKKTYEDIEVNLSDSNDQPEFIIRAFEIKHVKKEATQKVYQYHFHDWDESELPQNSTNLINMMRSIKKKLSMLQDAESNMEPTIITHCSDGGKCTGIFYALWNLLDSADSENMIDVVHTVKALRKQRPGIIPTYEQYQFLYDAIASSYPVQNGTLMSANGPSETSVEIISETTLEDKFQQEAVRNPLENKEEVSAKSDSSSNKQPTENPSNGPIISDENV
ncbi:receptor-type tyrosine-protein phosphatase C isoform X8 [Narcine bancroftii]|uniref:receptor-type tyrosine-protein phosphatase C isoform X8 n=1 Tax=Narcine bancroftii TaxID=1343680 RepID=UPI0038315B9C